MTQSPVAGTPSALLTLGVLAGGAGRRFGGRDKGWVEFDGVPQIVRLLDAWRPQVAAVVISANRSIERYRALGATVVSDPWPDYPGPMAGLVRLLETAASDRLACLPVDLLRWPDGLLVRLQAATADGAVAIAEDEDGPQPLIACYPTALHGEARKAFIGGERSVRRWQAGLSTRIVRFDGFRFGNRNTPDPAV